MTDTKTSRKEHILEAAAKLFSEQGFASVGMRDLAQAVGIESSSLYSHFGKKEDILWEIALHCAQDFNDTVSPIAHSDLHTKKKLQEMIIAHVDVTLRNRLAAPIFTTEWRILSEPRRSQYANLRDEYEKMFRIVIAKGVEENLFRPIDEKFSALTILSALNWTYLWYKPEGELTPNQIGETLAYMLTDGLVRTF
jgi:AcrR family transcriptional regulator